MARNPGEISRCLQSKFDFAPAKNRSPDHQWYELHLPGLPTILTKLSHGKKDIGAKLEGKIARQLRVRTQFFRKMIDCTRSREDYYQQVRTDPYPPWEIRF